MLSIVTYAPQYKDAFIALNREWLEKYFVVEAEDERMFADPEGVICKPGGEIFVALLDGEAVGVCALIPSDEESGIYELAKMGVRGGLQGQGIGRKLVTAAIDWACQQRAKRIELMSNTCLGPALHLYASLGFLETFRGPHPRYDRADIGMALDVSGTKHADQQSASA